MYQTSKQFSPLSNPGHQTLINIPLRNPHIHYSRKILIKYSRNGGQHEYSITTVLDLFTTLVQWLGIKGNFPLFLDSGGSLRPLLTPFMQCINPLHFHRFQGLVIISAMTAWFRNRRVARNLDILES